MARLLSTLQVLDDNQLAQFAQGVSLYSPPVADQGVQAIGREPVPLRNCVAAALRAFYSEPEDAPRLGVFLGRLGIRED